MKETIYTIPINDAFDANCSCALCAIQQKLDKEFVEQAVGASMMEPDFREITNQTGFCHAHYQALSKQNKALPLSLTLQTHSDTQNQALFSAMENVPSQSKGLFQKGPDYKGAAQNLVHMIDELQSRCAICEKLDYQLSRYTNNILYLWKTDQGFQAKFRAQKGFCLPHFALLLNQGAKELNGKEFTHFYQTITAMEKRALEQMYQDLTAFTKLFDYQSSEQPNHQVKTAVRRAIQQYSGLTLEEGE